MLCQYFDIFLQMNALVLVVILLIGWIRENEVSSESPNISPLEVRRTPSQALPVYDVGRVGASTISCNPVIKAVLELTLLPMLSIH